MTLTSMLAELSAGNCAGCCIRVRRRSLAGIKRERVSALFFGLSVFGCSVEPSVLAVQPVSPFPAAQCKKPRSFGLRGFLGCKSLTMTYFHTGTRTIIGAKSFHCPVRDGKEWYQLAMVIRHNLLSCCSCEQHNEFIESVISFVF